MRFAEAPEQTPIPEVEQAQDPADAVYEKRWIYGWFEKMKGLLMEQGYGDPVSGEYANEMPVEKWRCPACVGEVEPPWIND
jgi:hypothetical protein